MEAVIDNKKMWESLIKTMENGDPHLYSKDIISTLKDQGFEYKDGEIVCIEPEPRYHIGVDIGDSKGDIGVKQEYRKPEPFDIEKGMWLMCIKDFSSFDNSPLLFKKGNLYQCEDWEYVKYGIGDDEAYRFIACWQHFRPATPEEILKVKYGITGIGSKKAKGKLGELIKELYDKDPENFTCKLCTDTINPDSCTDCPIYAWGHDGKE